MGWLRRVGGSSVALVAVLLVLLFTLAGLQYRWIAQLSEAERGLLQASLEEGAAGFAADLDDEVTRAYETFALGRQAEGELTKRLTERLRRWRSTALDPDLVRDLWVIRRRPGADVELLRFDESTATLTRAAWSAELDEVRRRLGERAPGGVVDGELPGLVLAVDQGPLPGAGPRAWRPPRDHLVVRFDREVLTTTILPRLAGVHFGSGDQLLCSLTVTPAGRPDVVLFATGPQPAAGSAEPAVTEHLLGLRPAAGDDEGPTGGSRATPSRPERARGASAPELHRPLPARPPGPRSRLEPGRWRLAVSHPVGALAAAVTRARRRNLAISLATLLLLGATAVLMVATSRRAQRLARQQLDFVAAVSHELRTPLTAIRSAGQNLAEGIIDEPERVRRYGALVEREGRRLTDMIGRVLAFAGSHVDPASLRKEDVAIRDVVAAALADCRPALEESGLAVRTVIPENLPPVLGDASALRQVVANLVDNAVKYAASGEFIGLRVGRLPIRGGCEITVAVTDRGPGIPREEQRHLFEPFWRGRDAAAGRAVGSGLGLAVVDRIVRAHGGRVEVTSRPGGGATFTVHLPAAPGPGDEVTG